VIRINVGELFLQLKADSSQLVTGLGQAEGKVTKSADAMSKKLAGIGKGMTITGGVITGAVAKIVTSTAKVGDQFDKMSLRTGVAVEELSALAYAADICGTDIGTVEKGLKGLTKTMDDASKGVGEGKEAFEELGISVVDAEGNLRPTVEVLKEAATKIAAIENPTKQAALAMDIFGAKAGPQLLPLLKQGGDGIEELMEKADELGITMSTEAAAAAAEFTDRMTDLKGSLAGAGREIGNVLIPAITPLIERVIEIIGKVKTWAEENPKLVETIIKVAAVVGGLAAVGGPILMAVAAFTKMSGAISALGTLTSGPIGVLILAVGGVYLAWKNWDKIVEIVVNVKDKVIAKIEEWAGAINTWWENIVANTDNKWILVADKIMDAVKGAIKWITEAIGTLIKNIFGWWSNIETDTNSVWNKIKTAIIDSAKAWMKFFTDTLPGWISDVINFFTDFKRKAESVWKDIKTTIIKKVEEIVTGIFNVFEDLVNLPGKMLEWGKNAITGFTDGIKSKMSSVTDAVKGVGNKIKGFLGFESPPKEGPLSDSDRWMPNMMSMFGEGITSNIYKIETAGDELATAFKDKMIKLHGEVKTETEDMMDDVEGAVEDATPDVVGKANTLATNFMEVFENLKTDFKYNIVDPIVGYLENQLAGAIAGLLSQSEDFEWSWSKFWEGLKNVLINAVAAMIAKLVVLASFSWLFSLLGLPIGLLGFEKGGGVGYEKGGKVKGFASGGGTDTVPAMLTPGEYVISKPMVDFIKRTGAVTGDLINAIGTGARTPVAAFAGGGSVGNPMSSTYNQQKSYSNSIYIQPGAIQINTPKFGENDAQEIFRLIERQARNRGLRFATA
jgi:phage-related protein